MATVDAYPPLPEEPPHAPPLPDEQAPPLPPPEEQQLALMDPNNPPLPQSAASSSSEEEESEDEMDMPPGPVDPDQCMVAGPGTHGGSAQRLVRFKVLAKDERGKALQEGGDYIVARVSPGTAARQAGAEDVAVEITDHGDGTYVGAYSVPVRGDYKLIVDINGAPCGGSPFPLYFSPYDENAEPDIDIVTGKPQAQEEAEATSKEPTLVVPSAGPAAVAAGVELPRNEVSLTRSVLISNVSENLTGDQLRALFAFSGEVVDARLVGNKNQYAILEFKTPAEATAAMKMHDKSIAGKTITVELVTTAREAVLKTMRVRAANPLAAQQLQSLLTPAQLEEMQAEQRKLAEQVADLRAQQRQKVNGSGGGGWASGRDRASQHTEKKQPTDESDPQKAAAMAAAAALAKKLSGVSRAVGIGVALKHPPKSSSRRRSHSRSRSRDRRRRSRSRERVSRASRRSRSRSRSGKHRRSRSHGTRRDRSRDRKSSRRHRDSERRSSRDRSKGRGGRDEDRGGGDEDRGRYQPDQTPDGMLEAEAPHNTHTDQQNGDTTHQEAVDAMQE